MVSMMELFYAHNSVDVWCVMCWCVICWCVTCCCRGNCLTGIELGFLPWRAEKWTQIFAVHHPSRLLAVVRHHQGTLKCPQYHMLTVPHSRSVTYRNSNDTKYVLYYAEISVLLIAQYVHISAVVQHSRTLSSASLQHKVSTIFRKL